MAFQFSSRTLNVGELLAPGHAFHMPPFQRPFSWQEEDCAQLLDDVSTNYLDQRDQKKKRPYFLGQVILSQAHGTAPFEVIDGQQRLVALSAILAVLRDMLPNANSREHLHNYVTCTKANGQTVVFPRVSLRPIDRQKFSDWIGRIGGTVPAYLQGDTEATERLAAGIRRLKAEIGIVQASYLEGLSDYLLNRCFVSAVTATSPEDAYLFFRSVNARGMPLNDLDIARGEFLRPLQGDVAGSVRLADIWDEIEDELGVEQLQSYLKTVIYLALPSGGALDFATALKTVLRQPAPAEVFLTTLRRFLEIYGPLDRCEIDFGSATGEINRIIHCLQGLEKDDWKLAAILWLSKRPSNTQALDFFRSFDALMLGLVVLGAVKSTYSKRFHRIVESIVSDKVLTEPNSPLYLTEDEKRRIKERVGNPIDANARFLKPLLLRLNAAMCDKQMKVHFPKRVTVEHVLPQKPSPKSVWLQRFPNEVKRKQLSNMLGNLAILSASANPRANNYDFHKKREIIFGVKHSNTFPITAELTNYNDWTEDTIRQRQAKLEEVARSIIKY
ncbi:MAG: DUF262 domain-containing HNH endonuclease family protein [Rhodomicrobium sp.]